MMNKRGLIPKTIVGSMYKTIVPIVNKKTVCRNFVRSDSNSSNFGTTNFA